MRHAKHELNGKVVAITGGARGIGFAVAQRCAEAGMRVAIGDVEADLVMDAAARLGPSARGYVLDVRDKASFQSYLDSAEAELGPLDALVNNAGVLRMGPLAATDDASVDLQLDVNIKGVITGSRLALERFLTRGDGHLVNMASSAGMVATANGAAYSATKHAVLGFTRALRGELRGSGVRTTVVMPGVIRTDMTTDFKNAVGVRVVEPAMVAERIVEALRSGALEVCVPREIAVQGRLFACLPPRASDFLKRITRVDEVMH
ncbi:SDR family NAD(P)-dependent oxidoreductase [Nocardioides panzhihuensis]|uniref:NAD(P)-dependent dehydrogenase (Short-subunit alcohol dehydrogenase family) n=1 Tax=Nocardioides panzhihuensis TaxID=860243 RepID=A0A7Z0DKX8_9ACTN|nr:SDR family NAD(P)-dependent oxidoreductase [Nocardioides panzhihuensis]NYI77363.1 NAD(P)-dependent dehydrogenase (short-subunit alcohol dehydrogenase family) [Nocardioides panzhihuensis]